MVPEPRGEGAAVRPGHRLQRADLCVLADPSPGRSGKITADGAPPLLVVGTTGDPATPYQWAQALAGELSSGVLLTRKGEGHTAYGDSVCIQRNVDDYLMSLKVPAADTTCDP